MEFTPEEILERMEIYERYAYRIKELKDLLLDFDIYGDEDLIISSLQHQDEIMGEIRMIYQSKMVPILEEMAQYVSENMDILENQPQAEEPAGRKADNSVNEGDKSRETALDMGNSLLSSILKNMKNPNEK